MPENSTLPIDIEVRLDRASVGVVFSELEKQVASAGRKIGDSMSKAVSQERKIDKQLNVDRYFKEAQAIDKVTEAMNRQNAVFKAAGMRSPQAISNELHALKQARAAWEALGPATEGYKGALDQITRRTNILTDGNARARGSFHQLIAKVASLTFELTGAVYGFLALGSAIAGGAIIGVKFLKTIEDTKHGIAATLTAMSSAAGLQITYAQSSAIASQEINQLTKNAIKYNVSIEDIAKTYQAIIGPGMAAGMTLKEVGQIATIGTMAVKSLAMDSRQVVQEVRDLVQGGIQAASSTLATSLGLKDKDISEAKKSAEGLFVFLEKRMAGYALAAAERQNTLTGAWDVLKIKITRLFSDDAGFGAFKSWINDISKAIGEVDYKTGEIKFNPDLVKMADNYWKTLKMIGSVLSTIVEYSIKLAPAFMLVGTAFISWKVGAALLPIINAGIDVLIAKLVTVPAMINGVGAATTSLMTKFSGLSLASKGGIIGLAIYGTYELADHFGLIDSLFKTAENRAQQAYNKVKSMGTVAEVGAELEKQERQLSRMRGSTSVGFGERVSVFGAKGALNEYNMQREINAQEKLISATRASLDKITQSQKEQGEIENAIQRQQATKALNDLSSNLKDREGAIAKYNQRVANLGTIYANATRPGASKEDIEHAANIYTREMAEAKKELDSFGGKGSKTSTKSDAIDKNALTLETLMGNLKEKEKAAAEALAQFNGTAIDTELSLFTLNNTLEEFARKGIVVPEEMAAEMRKVAESTDELKTSLKEAKVFDDMRKQLEAISTATDQYVNSANDAIAVRQEELDIIGKSGVQVEILKNELALKKELLSIQTRYNALLAAMPPEQREAARGGITLVVDYEKQRAIDAAARQEESIQRTYEEQRTFETGWKDAFGKYKDTATNAADHARTAFQDMSKAMEDALYQFVTTGKMSFSSLVKSILEGLLKIQIQKTIAFAAEASGSSDWMKTILGLGVSAVVGSSTSSSTNAAAVPTSSVSQYSIAYKALGGAYVNGVEAFANGGAFTNSIVNSPTMFPFANGIGLMGEAGPEAIMPLTRTSGGELGVKTTGGSGGTNVSVVVNVDSSGSATSTTNAEGQGRELGDAISNAVVAELIKQKRNGGLLDSNRR